MLAPSRLFERTLRNALLEDVVRISRNSSRIPDRYQAATARSSQAAVAPDHREISVRKGRNSACSLLELQDPSVPLDPLLYGSTTLSSRSIHRHPFQLPSIRGSQITRDTPLP